MSATRPLPAQRIDPNKSRWVLAALLLVKLSLHFFLINPVYELHRDEFLHLDQAKHLAWGFESVPPFTSWLSLLIGWLGNGVFWVKLFPALFGALTIYYGWKLVTLLGGGWYAHLLCGIAICFSAILRINILYQPNAFDVLAWTAVYYYVARYQQAQQARWLYAAAIAFALGFLNKYNIIFLAFGLLPALLLYPPRRLFLRRELYIALAIALLIVAPNLWWQYTNGFPVVHHMNELARTQLVNVKTSDFLKEQVLYFLPSFYLVPLALGALYFYRPYHTLRLLATAFLVTFLLFILLRAKAYYAIGLYPAFLAIGAAYLELLLNKGWRFYLRLLPVLLILGLFPVLLQLGFPVLPPEKVAADPGPLQEMGLLRWEDGKDHHLPQDYADMVGWKEIARKTDSLYRTLPATENVLVLCDNYGQAGAINYYSSRPDSRAVSMNADYINWFPLDKPIDHVILVKDPTDDTPGRDRERTFFDSVYVGARLENKLAREYGLVIYVCRGAKSDINAILQEEILARKKR